MPLFHIQDPDRPAYVVAESYGEAVRKFLVAVAKENDGDTGDPPQGIQYVCKGSDLIVGDEFED